MPHIIVSVTFIRTPHRADDLVAQSWTKTSINILDPATAASVDFTIYRKTNGTHYGLLKIRYSWTNPEGPPGMSEKWWVYLDE